MRRLSSIPIFAAEPERASLVDMANGAIKERIGYEMPKVFDNLLDPNTDPKKERVVTLTLRLKANSERSLISVKSTTKSKLQETDPIEFNLAVSGFGNSLTVYELPSQVPGQYSLDGTQTPAPAILEMIREV